MTTPGRSSSRGTETRALYGLAPYRTAPDAAAATATDPRTFLHYAPFPLLTPDITIHLPSRLHSLSFGCSADSSSPVQLWLTWWGQSTYTVLNLSLQAQPGLEAFPVPVPNPGKLRIQTVVNTYNYLVMVTFFTF